LKIENNRIKIYKVVEIMIYYNNLSLYRINVNLSQVILGQENVKLDYLIEKPAYSQLKYKGGG